MPTDNLKSFKATWTHACKSMWIEIASLRHVQGRLLGDYGSLPKTAKLTDLAYAPECVGRIDDSTPDFFLEHAEEYIGDTALLRIVLLSAAFEVFFENFVGDYLDRRPKYTAAGVRTDLGNKVVGEVRQGRGAVAKVKKFFEQTDARTNSVAKYFDALNDVYLLRCIIAHRAGVCDGAASQLKIVKFAENERVRVSASQLVTQLAPPCISLAENLDKRVVPPR